MSNKNQKPDYKIEEISENFIKLIFEKGYVVSSIVNGKFHKPYTKKPIKYAEKLLNVIQLKKPREARIYFIENDENRKYANEWYNYITLILNDKNEAVVKITTNNKHFEELYREAKFLTDIQFWK